MKNILFPLAFLLILSCSRAQDQKESKLEGFSVDIVAENLSVPWELVYGPDNNIWFTERPGRIQRLNPETGEQNLLIEIDDVIATSETGLLGLALDPDFETSPLVYTVYTYLKSGDLTERVVRFTYNSSNNSLNNEEILLDDIPAANNHSGSRLLFMPDKTLLITTGDALNTSLAQNTNSLAGKTLRMMRNGDIPNDNPINNSYVYSWGHRNAQGLCIGPNNVIYNSEHGPNSDDEINIIEKGRNYGWPDVRGFCDASEQQYCDDNNIKEAIEAYTPTLAVAGLAYYAGNTITEFENSLLLVNLKEADFRVLKLSNDGMSIDSETILFDRTYGRLRAICTAPNGDVYFSTSNKDGRAPSGFPAAQDDKIFRIRANSSTGIVSNGIKEFKINSPVDNSINFSSVGRVNAKIYNSLGQLIKSINNGVEILVNDLPSGWYVLNISKNNNFSNNKFYKE